MDSGNHHIQNNWYSDVQNNFNISKSTFKMTFCSQTLPPPWTVDNHL